jgi:hypothetical protein
MRSTSRATSIGSELDWTSSSGDGGAGLFTAPLSGALWKTVNS